MSSELTEEAKAFPAEVAAVRSIAESPDSAEVERMAQRALVHADSQLPGLASWKGGPGMSGLKKAVPIGIAAAAVVVAVVMAVSSGNVPPAAAAQTAKASYQAVSNLSPEQLQALARSTGRLDSQTVLKEAQGATDLEQLTYSELAGESDSPLPPDPDGRLRSLRFLRFTRTNGEVVTLGIGADNLPAFISVLSRANGAGAKREGGTSTTNIQSDSGEAGAMINIDGKQIEVPPGTDPSTVELRNGKVYVNGVEIK